MPRPSRRGAAVVAALTTLGLTAGTVAASVGGATAADPQPRDAARVYDALAAKRAPGPDYVKVDLLALNDFHGNLEPIPSTSSSGRIGNTPASGAEYLATVLKQERATSRAGGATPITVAAGDLIGASPLLSAAFHDEPAIKAMNKVGLDVASVGNHEFDEGWRELLRMQRGGCLDDGPEGRDGQNSCPGDQGFDGARFQYLGANVAWDDAEDRKRDTVLPATKVVKVDGQKIGFIGMTLEGTASIVAQAGIQGISFRDEVRTANRLVPQLRQRGVESIVVLLHEGITPSDSGAYNDCTGPQGPAQAIAEDLKPAIDVVVSGHTHQAYNCVVDDPAGNPRLLTSASSFGRMVTKIQLLVDPRSGDVVRPAATASNRIVANTSPRIPADRRLTRLIDTYSTLVEPIANEVIGHIDPLAQAGDTISRDTVEGDTGGDSPLGNLIADGQKVFGPIQGDAPEDAPVVALMNPGGIRSDLVEDEAGDVTYGAAFAVQPFSNFMVSMDLTGAQLLETLEQQWNGGNEGAPKILQVSGLEYTWDETLADQEDVPAVVGDVLVDADGDPQTAAVPLDPAATYRVAANNFLADGGDSFSALTAGSDRIVSGLDIDALRAYLEANDPVAETPTDRITSVNPLG